MKNRFKEYLHRGTRTFQDAPTSCHRWLQGTRHLLGRRPPLPHKNHHSVHGGGWITLIVTDDQSIAKSMPNRLWKGELNW